MILSVALFALFSVLAYVCISLFGQMTGSGASTLWGAALSALRPLPLLILVAGNVFFSMAVYSGLAWTRFAIPAALALGVITSFIYSALFLGGTVTLLKLAGVALILCGIFFLR